MANFIVNRCGVTETLNADIPFVVGVVTGDTIVSDVGICYEVTATGGTGADITILTNPGYLTTCNSFVCEAYVISGCSTGIQYDVKLPSLNPVGDPGQLIVWNNQCFGIVSHGGLATYVLDNALYVPQVQLSGLTCDDGFSACTSMNTYVITDCNCGGPTYTVNLPSSAIVGQAFEYNGRCYTINSQVTFDFYAKFLDVTTFFGDCTSCIPDLS